MVIEGDEDHLIQESYKEVQSIVTEDMESFVVYGDQVVSDEFHNNLNTLSFFSESKVFIIKTAESLPKESIESLLNVFKTKPEGLHAVLFFKKIDKRKKIFKELLSIATAFEMKPPFENQMTRWVQSLAKDKGMGVKSDHVELIRHLVGDGLTDVSEALDRLKDNYNKGPYTEEMIQKSVSLKRRSNLFKICDLIGFTDFTGASLEMDRAITEGESPVALTHLLLRHFDILIKIKSESSRASKYDLAKVVGVPAFFVPNYKQQSDIWNKEDLFSMQMLLEDFDIMAKSTGLKPAAFNSALLIRSTAIFGKKTHLMSSI